MWLTQRFQNVPHLSHGDEALALSVEGFERLHKVGECTGVRLGADGFVNRQNFFECVLFLTCSNRKRQQLAYWRKHVE